MTRHISEDLLSQRLDRELDSEQAAQLEEHLKCCESCQALEKEMSETDRIFRSAGVLEPPPYLWPRIAARLETESSREKRRSFGMGWLSAWMQSYPRPAWLRATVWAPAAILLIAIGATIAFMEYQSVSRAHIGAIAEIDRAHVALLTLDNKTYNPFHESTATDSGINPFTQSNLKDQPNPFRTVLDRP
jgi:predicted anti-sigma-YlaC factor YlaD